MIYKVNFMVYNQYRNSNNGRPKGQGREAGKDTI